MTPLTLTAPLAQAATFVGGVVSHLAIFRHGEWHLATNKIIITFVASQAAAIMLLPYVEAPIGTDGSHSATADVSLTLGAIWTMGVFASMLIYRGFFHRLGQFPGPFFARFSNWYVTSLRVKKLHLYEEVQQLHSKYGDIVRLGPSELSINNSEMFAAISAANSPCTKSDWYDLMQPMVSMQNIRNIPEHSARRRIWDRGFNAKALRDYEPRVTSYAAQLLDKIATSEGKPLNATDWFNFYSFDLMGDLAWGKSFGMLRNGVKHYFMKSLHDDMTHVGLLSHVVWLFPFFKSTPVLNATHLKFWGWVNAQVSERRKTKPEKADIFSWLLDDYDSKPRTRQEEINLSGDAYLIMVAGSETTAASLTCLFFHLATSPEVLKKVQIEVDNAYAATSSTTPDFQTLSKLVYLNAVITETIRLHPPVPSGLARQTPAEGLLAGDVYIPGNTIVQVPSHTIYRDERYWVKPNEFIPERWTTAAELVKDGSVYAPFGHGRFSCIGKQLALMELRYVTAELVRRYDVRLAPGQTAEAFLEGKRDTFTLALDELNLVFDKRFG